MKFDTLYNQLVKEGIDPAEAAMLVALMREAEAFSANSILTRLIDWCLKRNSQVPALMLCSKALQLPPEEPTHGQPVEVVTTPLQTYFVLSSVENAEALPSNPEVDWPGEERFCCFLEQESVNGKVLMAFWEGDQPDGKRWKVVEVSNTSTTNAA